MKAPRAGDESDDLYMAIKRINGKLTPKKNELMEVAPSFSIIPINGKELLRQF